MKYLHILSFLAFATYLSGQGLDLRMFDGDQYAIQTSRTTSSGPFPIGYTTTSRLHIGTTKLQTSGNGILGNYFPYLTLNPDGGNIAINGTTASTSLHIHQKDYERYIGGDGSDDIIPVDGGITLETTVHEYEEEGGSGEYNYKWRIYVSKYGNLCFSLNGEVSECFYTFSPVRSKQTTSTIRNDASVASERVSEENELIEKLLDTIGALERRLSEVENQTQHLNK